MMASTEAVEARKQSPSAFVDPSQLSTPRRLQLQSAFKRLKIHAQLHFSRVAGCMSTVAVEMQKEEFNVYQTQLHSLQRLQLLTAALEVEIQARRDLRARWRASGHSDEAKHDPAGQGCLDEHDMRSCVPSAIRAHNISSYYNNTPSNRPKEAFTFETASMSSSSNLRHLTQGPAPLIQGDEGLGIRYAELEDVMERRTLCFARGPTAETQPVLTCNYK